MESLPLLGFRVLGVDTKNSNPKFTGKYQAFHYTFIFNAYVTGCIAISDYRKDEKDRDRVYIRRERYAGACSRSFYVGENVKQEDIKACFEDGTLKLQVPKNSKEVVVENPNYITIEG